MHNRKQMLHCHSKSTTWSWLWPFDRWGNWWSKQVSDLTSGRVGTWISLSLFLLQHRRDLEKQHTCRRVIGPGEGKARFSQPHSPDTEAKFSELWVLPPPHSLFSVNFFWKGICDEAGCLIRNINLLRVRVREEQLLFSKQNHCEVHF